MASCISGCGQKGSIAQRSYFLSAYGICPHDKGANFFRGTDFIDGSNEFLPRLKALLPPFGQGFVDQGL